MIIEKTVINDYPGKTYNQLYSETTYYAVGYTPDKVIRLFTSEDDPIPGGHVVSSLLDGFGADTYQELLDEANQRGLTWPT